MQQYNHAQLGCMLKWIAGMTFDLDLHNNIIIQTISHNHTLQTKVQTHNVIIHKIIMYLLL